MQLQRGRLIDHIQLVVADLGAAARFYEAVMGALEIPLFSSDKDHVCYDELYISNAETKAAQGKLTGRHHLAFAARDREMVDIFHAAALEAGGKDNGPPGERPYHPGYYAAFVLDPAGNNIEAVYHGPAKYSAASITIDIGK